MANILNKTKLISLENYVFSLAKKNGKNLCIHLVYRKTSTRMTESWARTKNLPSMNQMLFQCFGKKYKINILPVNSNLFYVL